MNFSVSSWIGLLCGGAILFASVALAADLPGAAEIAQLRQEIVRHDRAYHQQSASELSDADYDRLRQRLTALEREYPAAAQAVPPLPALPDDRSGAVPTGRHREPMLSLDKAYTEAELRGFHARVARQLGHDDIAYTVEPKFDGLAVSITYVGGRLMRALTRGNGAEGDDVTANVRRIPGVPAVLAGADAPQLIEVRGEVFVPWAEFARVNGERDAAEEPRFANPRNLAAGTLRQRDPELVTARGLRLTFFGVGTCQPLAVLPETQREMMARFAAWGLPVITLNWPARGADQLISAVQTCERERSQFPFPADGAVVKIDRLASQRDLGSGDGAPRWALAYKFPPERVATQLLAITIQVGRTGVLTPVAELAPVNLAGTTVARATLHNRGEIARNDIRIGDWVYVEKAGEIIPAIVGVDRTKRLPSAVPFVFPSACPECRGGVNASDDAAAVRCVNRECPAQIRRRIEHFVARDCVALEGFGPAVIDALVSRGGVKDIADLYRLSRADLQVASRSGERAERLQAAIERSKDAELWRVINGLGLPQVGAAGAKQLARKHGSLAALAAADPAHRPLIESLLAVGFATRESAERNSALSGKTFVLTGTLPNLTRAQATQRIEAAGGKVVSAVSRSTQFVVAGAAPGSKLADARRLGVSVIDEAQLLQILTAGAPPATAPQASLAQDTDATGPR